MIKPLLDFFESRLVFPKAVGDSSYCRFLLNETRTPQSESRSSPACLEVPTQCLQVIEPYVVPQVICLQVLSARLEAVESCLEVLSVRMEAAESCLEVLSARMEAVDSCLEVLNARMEAVESCLEVLVVMGVRVPICFVQCGASGLHG